MPEQTTTRYSQWFDEKETCDMCRKCMRKKEGAHFGALFRRRVIERNGDMYNEYKVVCRSCDSQTLVHRSKMIAIKEWEGKQQPGDGLKYRTRGPMAEIARESNIALNREAEVLKGDDSNGLKESHEEN